MIVGKELRADTPVTGITVTAVLANSLSASCAARTWHNQKGLAKNQTLLISKKCIPKDMH